MVCQRPSQSCALMRCNRLPLLSLDAKDTTIDPDEVECIVANLIAKKYMKGYISHQQQKMVLSKKEPFPALDTVAL